MKLNWVEYSLEALGLAIFMFSASAFAVLLFHPASPAVQALPDPVPRRVLMGLAMGATALLNIYSPWGKRSGAHLNPATTLTFYSLGKVKPPDLVGYIAGQFVGGALGMMIAHLAFQPWIGDPAVDYVATVPGPLGAWPAFLGEWAITFILMFVVLAVIAHPRAARYTGFVVAGLVSLYIAVESPISGMSMNPARTTASAVFASSQAGLWVYFTAPLIGMLAAAHLRRHVAQRHCAKMVHDSRYRCVFCGGPGA